VYTIPPHSPFAASPTPMIRGSSGPNRTVGPDGHAFAKWKPLLLGRKFGMVSSFSDRSPVSLRGAD
jgi:hypothetical protein